MKRPEEVTLSREDGEALIERLEKDALTAEDRRVLVKVLTFYFWLLGRSLRNAPDLGTRATRIDFLYCRLYASVHFHRTLASSMAYARVPCRWTSTRPRAAQISGKIGLAICH
jgi:hypothetical protein